MCIAHLLRGLCDPFLAKKSPAIRLRSSCNSGQIGSVNDTTTPDDYSHNLPVGLSIVHLLGVLCDPFVAKKSPAIRLRSSCNSGQIGSVPWSSRRDEQFYNM